MVTSIKVSVLSFSRGSLVAPLFLSASSVHSSLLWLHRSHLIILLAAPLHYTSQDATVWAGLECSSSSMFLMRVKKNRR